MAVQNKPLTVDHITKRSLMVLKNQLGMANLVNREYSDQFKVKGAKIGDTISIRKPARFNVREGRIANPQAFEEEKIPLKLDQQSGIDLEFTSKELTLNIEEFDRRILTPQIAALANMIDVKLLTMAYQSTSQTTTGSAAQLLTWLGAGAILDESNAPNDGNRNVVVDAVTQAIVVDSLKGLFNSQNEIDKQYRNGKMYRAAGFDWGMSQNVIALTNAARGGNPAVNGAGQTGAVLNTSGWVASRLVMKKGETFTITGVNAVNPSSRADTGRPRYFVVLNDVTSDGSGNAQIQISPALTPADNIANKEPTVTVSPASGAAISPTGTAGQVLMQNLAFHRDAFALASADLVLPDGVHKAARASSEAAGLSVRIVQDYDVYNDAFITRLDILYGMAPIYPDWAVRVQTPRQLIL